MDAWGLGRPPASLPRRIQPSKINAKVWKTIVLRIPMCARIYCAGYEETLCRERTAEQVKSSFFSSPPTLLSLFSKSSVRLSVQSPSGR